MAHFMKAGTGKDHEDLSSIRGEQSYGEVSSSKDLKNSTGKFCKRNSNPYLSNEKSINSNLKRFRDKQENNWKD